LHQDVGLNTHCDFQLSLSDSEHKLTFKLDNWLGGDDDD